MTELAGCPDWPVGVGLAWHASIDSTNAEALRICDAGETGPLWIMAEEQTAGRGRRGRSWTSPPGNLYATLLLTVAMAPAAASQAGFVAGLAVRDCIADLVGPAVPLSLKWPNDVLADGRKVCGILGENLRDHGNGRMTLAIGMGLNLASAPPETRYPAAALANFAAAPSPRHAGCRLAIAMARWLDVWDAGRGFAPIRAAWTGHAAGLGRDVLIEGERVSPMTARIDGLAEDGALAVVDANGERHLVYAGDVSITVATGATP